MKSNDRLGAWCLAKEDEIDGVEDPGHMILLVRGHSAISGNTHRGELRSLSAIFGLLCILLGAILPGEQAVAKDSPPTCPGQLGCWHEKAEQSRLSGKMNVRWELPASEKTLASQDVPIVPLLSVACEEGRSRAFLNFNIYLDAAKFAYRIDGQKALFRTAVLDDDGISFGFTGEGAIGFLKELIGRRTLYVRVHPSDGEYREADFALSGIDHAIGAVRKACNW